MLTKSALTLIYRTLRTIYGSSAFQIERDNDKDYTEAVMSSIQVGIQVSAISKGRGRGILSMNLLVQCTVC